MITVILWRPRSVQSRACKGEIVGREGCTLGWSERLGWRRADLGVGAGAWVPARGGGRSLRGWCWQVSEFGV